MTAASPFNVFSASDAHLGAECPQCGRVLKIPRHTSIEIAGGYRVEGGITCACGHESAEILQDSPEPRTPEKQPSRAETIFAQGLVWGFVVLLLAGIGYVLVVVVGVVSDFDSAEVPPLSAEVRISEGQIHLTNSDAFDWTACTISLNAGIGGSWSQDVGRVPAGQTVSGGLMAFTRGRGERFNPVTHAVEDILVDCATPAGRSYWSGRL